jgi:RNA-directed DNA polymerase
LRPLLSPNALARLIQVPRARLESIAADVASHYREWVLVDKKNPAKQRMIRSPLPELKRIQRAIVACVLRSVPLAEIVHGGVRGRSPRSNAEQHLAQQCLVTLDVREFYQHVHHDVVYHMFRRELGHGRDVARLLTRLTTYRDELPRGAPTSLAVANLVLTAALDQPLALKAHRLGINVTRFVDDIALSGSNPRELINVIAKMLSRRRLPMYREKAKFQSKPKLRINARSRPQEVTGLLVNRSGTPSLSRDRRDRVRAAICALKHLGKGEREQAVQSIRGRIRHVAGFNPGSAKRLERYLKSELAEL